MVNNQQEFEALVKAMGSTDNVARKAAEETFNDMMLNRTDFIVSALVTVANVGQPDVKQLSLVLLRKVVLRKELFEKISPAAMANVRKDLLNVFGTTDDKMLRKAASNAVASIANTGYQLEPKQTWDDLWPLMFDTVANGSADPALRLAVLQIFTEVADVYSIGYFNNNHLDSLAAGFASCMAVNNSDLQCEAFVASAAYLLFKREKKMPQEFPKLIPPMMTVLGQALQQNNYKAAQKMLGEFCGVLENNPKLVRPFLQNILEAMMQVAGSTNVEAGVRHMAIECMLACCESDPKAVKKIKGFVQSFFNLMFRYTLKQEVPEDWETTFLDEEDDVDDEDTDTDIGSGALDRLAIAIGGKELKDLVVSTTMQGVKDTQWQSVSASLSMLTVVAEGCRDVLLDDLGNILGMVAPFLEHDNTRIRGSAVRLMTRLMEDFYQPMTKKYIRDVLPLMIKRLNDSVPRIQCSAMAFFITLLGDEHEPKKGSKSPAAPVVRDLIMAMVQALKTTKYDCVRKETLRALSETIDNLETLMTPFAADFVALFREILALPEPSTTDPAVQSQYQMTIGCTVECLTILATAVGKEAYAPYAKDVCEYLAGMTTKLAGEDRRLRFILRGWTCMVETMGDDVAGYVQVVIPMLITVASMPADAEIVPDEGDEQDESVYTCTRISIPGAGKRVIRYKTALVEDKTLALNILSTMVKVLKGKMMGYVDDLMKVAESSIGCTASEEVQEMASDLYPLIGTAIKDAKPDQLNAYANVAFKKLLDHVKDEVDPDVSSNSLANLRGVIELADRNSINDEVIGDSVKAFSEIFKYAVEEMLSGRDENDDDDDEEDDGDDEEAIDYLLTNVVDTVADLLKKYDRYVQQFERAFLPLVDQLLGSTATNTMRRFGLSLLADYADFGKSAAFAKREHILKAFVDAMDKSTEADVLQAAVYGIGALVYNVKECGPAELEGLVRVAAPPVIRLLNNGTVSKDKEYMAVRANAVSTLMKFLEVSSFAPQLVGATIPLIVQNLPCGDDEQEARIVHRKILEWLVMNKVEALSAQRPQLVQMFKKLLDCDLKACEEAETEDIAVLDKESREEIRKL